MLFLFFDLFFDLVFEFGYVGGLKQNAPVYYAGREVGKVGKIEVLYGKERPILVTIKIDEKIDLREDSEANVDTLGMLGEKMVEITPGSASVSTLATSTRLLIMEPCRARYTPST